MDRHRSAPGLCYFGPRSVSATQIGRAVCVGAVLCLSDTLSLHTVFLCVSPRSRILFSFQMTVSLGVDKTYLRPCCYQKAKEFLGLHLQKSDWLIKSLLPPLFSLPASSNLALVCYCPKPMLIGSPGILLFLYKWFVFSRFLT